MYTACLTYTISLHLERYLPGSLLEHLEIAQDVLANALILVLRRYIARCVNPRLFTSDNFKLFKSLEANKFLRKC